MNFIKLTQSPVKLLKIPLPFDSASWAIKIVNTSAATAGRGIGEPTAVSADPHSMPEIEHHTAASRRQTQSNAYLRLCAQTDKVVERHEFDLASRNIGHAGLGYAQTLRG